jgi:hypothetical protein
MSYYPPIVAAFGMLLAMVVFLSKFGKEIQGSSSELLLSSVPISRVGAVAVMGLLSEQSFVWVTS